MSHLRKLSLLIVVLITASAVFATTAQAQGATRDFGAESGFVASLNAQRAAGGLAPLAVNGSMTAAADGWTQQMVNGSFLAHAGDIVSGTPAGWSKVGENVGRGQSVSSLTTAFMNSPAHRANIMDASYTHIGIAVYQHPSDGRLYTTHRFASLPSAAPVAAPAPVEPTPVPVVPATPVPATPAPATPVPATPVPATPVPATPVPATPVPATPVPATPVPATPVPATPVPATPVPATPVPATPVPATPVPATPVPATPVPATPLPSPEPADDDFGTPPQLLAFVDAEAAAAAADARLSVKQAKLT